MYVPVYRVELVREGRQAVRSSRVTTPESAAAVVQEHLRGFDREAFVVLGLSTKNRLLGIHTVSVGCLDATLVHPREVFKAAILMNAAAIVVAHNHPSGCPEPSPEDRSLTVRLGQSGSLLGIDVLDHVVLGEDRFVSLREQGVLPAFAPVPASSQDEDTPEPHVERTPGGAEYARAPRLVFARLSDAVFEHQVPNGTIRAWNVTEGLEIARNGHPVMRLELTQIGMTLERILAFNDEANPTCAMKTDLRQPLLFIPLGTEELMIDGWHRLFKAVALGLTELPMYLLSKEEADGILLFELFVADGQLGST